MEFFEVCREAFSGKAEALALHMGRSRASVYKYGQRPTDDGKVTSCPSHLLADACLFVGDLRPIEWLANRVGLIVYHPEQVETTSNHHNFKQMCLDFGMTVESAGDAMADGKITRAEAEDVWAKGMRLIKAIMIMIASILHQSSAQKQTGKL